MLKYLALALLLGVVYGHEHGHDIINSMKQGQIKKLQESIFTPDYLPTVRPYGVNSTEYETYVYLFLKKMRVVNVDTTKGVFTIQGVAKKGWIDTRLAYNDTTVPFIPVKDCKKMWVPNLFSPEHVEVADYPMNFEMFPHDARIYPSGKVYAAVRFTKSLYCPQIRNKDVKDFSCFMHLVSFAEAENEMKLMYKKEGVTVDTFTDKFLPGFTLEKIEKNDKCAELMKDLDHKHACLGVEFRFKRV